MLAANYWKAQAEEATGFFDRGMRLFVYEETGVFMEKAFINETLSAYVDYGTPQAFYQGLWGNAQALRDIRVLDELRRYRDTAGRELRSLLRERMARALGSFRRHPQGAAAELDFAQIRPLLDANEAYLAQIGNMSVPGMIAKNIQEHFMPALAALLVSIAEGREPVIMAVPVAARATKARPR